MMAQKIAFVNNKGGSAKTTSAVNIAGAIHVLNPKTKILVVEGDAQGNASRSFKVKSKDLEATIYDVFMGDKEPEEVIYKEVYQNIDLIPANTDMNFFEFDKMKDFEETFSQGTLDLAKHLISKGVDISAMSYEEWNALLPTHISMTNNYYNMLDGKFAKLDAEYDFIIFDTPPELKSVTSSIIAISDSVMIPFEPDLYSLDGIINILDRIEIIQKAYNPELKIGGLIAVKVKAATNLHKDVRLSVTDFANLKSIPYYSTIIPNTIKFATATAYSGYPATLSKKKNTLIDSYFDLVDEMINKGAIELEVEE